MPSPHAASFREWLDTDRPSSRGQANAIRAYHALGQFWDNPLARYGFLILFVLAVSALFAPLIGTYSPYATDLANRLQPPSASHWFGTDDLGRDVFARVLYGGRTTLLVAVSVLVIIVPIGLLIGIAAGYFGGLLDTVLMRIADLFLSLPRLVLALALVASLGPSLQNAIIAIALTSWPAYARIARAETLILRRADFITIVDVMGGSKARIILRHIAPLCTASVVVRATIDMAGIIITTAGLGFLGLGAQPPAAEWGSMVAGGRQFLQDQWWISTFPGLAILAASFGFNLVGDGLRDLLDPKS